MTLMLYEKAVSYAERCISGEEVTTPEVKTQSEWFLADLEKQSSEEYAYYFDHKKLAVVENLLKLMCFATGIGVIGQRVYDKIADFQAFFLANVFGWRCKDDSDKFRYRECVLFVPRKSAKTFLVAVVIIILMLTEENYSEFYSICLDRDLAGEVKKAIRQIIEASPALTEYFKIPKTLSGRVECLITHSFYQPRTAEANRNNAIRPSAFIADEYGAMKDNSNVAAMKSGQLSVKNPLMFKVTTAYAEDKSIMLDELDYLKRIYAGTETDERLFALLYYAPEDHLWDDIGLEMANPLRVPENYYEIRESRAKALAKPSEREEFLTKHMNHFVPSNSGEEFIAIEDMKKCRNADAFNWAGRDVYVGIDLAMTNDNCAVAMVTADGDKIAAKAWSFIPADKVDSKSQLERTDYRRFIRNGSCFPCGDEVVDYGFIEQFIVEMPRRFGVNVIQIGYDRYNCISTANKLDSAGFECVEVKQHSSVLHPPIKLIRDSILGGNFEYDADPQFESNFQSARALYDTNLNMYLSKKKSTGKIDMLMATVDAVYLLQQDMLFGRDTFVVQI